MSNDTLKIFLLPLNKKKYLLIRICLFKINFLKYIDMNNLKYNYFITICNGGKKQIVTGVAKQYI